MCIRNTITCPTCNNKRSDFISCLSRSRSRSRSGSAFRPSPSHHNNHLTIPHTTASPHDPVLTLTCGSIKPQELLSTCPNCTNAYRIRYDQSLRRSLAMSRSAPGSIAGAVLNGSDVEMEDPLDRLLEEERRNVSVQWEAYEKREVERLCKRRGVMEDEIVYA